MGRKAQITKEQILQNGLEMINENGWENVNITTLAKRLNCSTQPVIWHFGSMENFRAELSEYVMDFIKGKFSDENKNPVSSYLEIGTELVKLAFEQPKLAQFMLSEKLLLDADSTFVFAFDDEKNTSLSFAFSNTLGIDVFTAKEFFKSVAVYTLGLLNTIASENISLDLENSLKMYQNFGVRFLTSCGLSRAKAKSFYSY